MNGLYEMLLFLFILGAATQAVNELGMFDVSVSDTGVTALDDSVVTDISDATSSTNFDSYTTLDILFGFMKVIGMGIVAMFTIVPLILQWGTELGCPYAVAVICAGILQAPVSWVTFTGLYEWWTGRPIG